jgi:hypothetical protein
LRLQETLSIIINRKHLGLVTTSRKEGTACSNRRLTTLEEIAVNDIV